jgi:hypothetical protein
MRGGHSDEAVVVCGRRFRYRVAMGGRLGFVRIRLDACEAGVVEWMGLVRALNVFM